jgi:plastocyanin
VIDSQTGEAVPNAHVMVNNGTAAEPVSAEMVQENRQFRPKILTIPKNSEVNFPNQDATQHHVYSFSPAKMFNLELFADKPEAPVVFDKTGVVEVGCNIHDNMQGFILVTDSSITARTDSSGKASLSVPDTLNDDSDLSLSLWHPRMTDNTRTVDFSVSLPVTDPVELSLDLAPAPEKTGRLDGLQKRFQDL